MTQAVVGPVRKPTSFDKVARVYRWAEYLLLGPLLVRMRRHFLPRLTSSRHALVLGDGDGRFLASLLGSNPRLRAVALDGSAGMLRLAAARCRRSADRLTLQKACLPPLPPDLPLFQVDLVVTHFFLDCLRQAEVEQLARQLADGVAPGCLWVVSEFGLPRNGIARLLARVYLRALYFAFHLLTRLQVQSLPDIGAALTQNGFQRVQHSERLGGLLYAELWRLSDRPHNTGMSSGAQLRAPTDHQPMSEHFFT